MSHRLSWNIVKEHFRDQWIELADYRWDWEAPYPAWVVVKNHAADREELLSMATAQSGSALSVDRTNSVADAIEESDRVILFVGATHAVSALRTTSI
jgi:hypothetical protein